MSSTYHATAPELTGGENFRPWQLVLTLARVTLSSLLPFPDIIRRGRVRRAARELVTCEPWPGDKAEGSHAAQLAIMRLLWLQRQTRRAVRSRHREASVLLARASAETCILGMYCLTEPTAVKELEAAGVRTVRDMFGYMADADLIPAEVIERCIAGLGAIGPYPNVRAMVDCVNAIDSAGDVGSLYRRFYIPTSNFFAHANAASLLRHTGRAGKIKTRPGRAWTRRSPARVADASVGILAEAVAKSSAKPAERFCRYADAHLRRAVTPLAVLAGVGYARSAATPAVFLNSLKAFRSTGRYVWSRQAQLDPADTRLARIRAGFETALNTPRLDIPAAAIDPLFDYFATDLSDFVEERGRAEPETDGRV